MIRSTLDPVRARGWCAGVVAGALVAPVIVWLALEGPAVIGVALVRP